MAAPEISLTVTGTDPKLTTLQNLETEVNDALEILWDSAVVASLGEAEAEELRLELQNVLAETEANATESAANAAASQNLASQGLIPAPNGPVDCATTANITLSGEQTIDGILTSASRVLVKNQTTTANNGIYVSAAGSWSRATDMDAAGEVRYKSVYVNGGTVNAGKTFYTASAVTTLGTDTIVWTEVSGQSYVLTDAIRFRRRRDEAAERIAQLPAGLSFASSVTQTGFDTYDAAASGDCYWNMYLVGNEAGITTFDVVLTVTSGSPSAITIDQRNSGGSAIAGTSGTAVNEGNGVWARRGLTLDGAFSYLRVRVQNGGASPTLSFGPPVIQRSGTIAVSAAKASGPSAATQLMATAANAAQNLWSMLSVVQLTGTGSTGAGRGAVIPSGNRTAIYASAAQFAPSDSVMIVFRASAPFRTDTFDFIPHTGGGGGGGTTNLARLRSLGNGWYMAYRANSEAAAAAQAVRFEIYLDNRSGGAGWTPSGAVTFSDFWIAKNATDIPSMVTVPAAVTKALGDAGALTIWVDPAGSDTAAGDAGTPVATVAEALNRGASRLMLRKSSTVHRHSGLSISRNVEFVGYAASGDTEEYARMWASQNLTGASFTATVADANVYYVAMAASPIGVWELVGTVATRFGRVQADPGAVRANFAQAETSEVNVRAGAGRWWWGAGSAGTGLYLRPSSDTFTGKSYEVPVANVGIALTGADVVFDGVSASFGRNNAVSVTRSTVRARRSAFRRSGDSDAVNIISGVSHWLDEGDCLYTDAGDDGVNLDGGGATFSGGQGSRAIANVGDGVAPHSAGNTVRLQGMEMSNNGKQGFVTIGTGTFELVNCDCRGNTDLDILIRLGALTTATTVKLYGNSADEAEVSADTESTITGTVTNHRGPLLVKANLEIEGHRCVKSGRRAFDMNGGAVTLRDFYYSGNTHGIDISAGTLTVDAGQVLRNTTGILQSGGTLTLDSANPVNVFGNGTQFSGVSAPDQALTVAVSAV
jgi:hypothetical protein